MELKEKVIRARRCLNRDTLDLPDVIRADIMNTVGNLAQEVQVDKDYENDQIVVHVEFIDGRKKTYLYELYVENLHFKYSKRLLEKREVDTQEHAMLKTWLQTLAIMGDDNLHPYKVVNKEATPYTLIGGRKHD